MNGSFVLDSVSCGYGGKKVLDGFSAEIRGGALTALIGPNGSGKSTLLKLLGGIAGYVGSAALDGRELRSMSRAEFGRAVGFVPQQTKITTPFTVYEVIAMGRLPYCGLFSKLSGEDDAAVLRAAERAGVSHLLFRRASELSGGEQQRVCVAVALAQEPEVFLLDEPTSALDPNQSVRIFSIMRALASEGRTVVVAAHDINGAIPFSDRFIALRGGGLAAQGEASELDENILAPLYGIEFKKYVSEEGGRAWHPSAKSFSL
ncbi:ABC transporter ATP-binding protein [Cloacibacillus sp. An23]|uniref:ABC transporter ATP-binding protein n=1 Tax=Cloacibacillus sp. An23 TaxID=1965591 RepID=UPI000B36A57E|nr:ABC transporter ATP-binding protein [Cloacibacillus sp. An23]OUO94450.1 ferrichrome ABC transporter ATP-binding protein [Cloacibacillus sp. An23]